MNRYPLTGCPVVRAACALESLSEFRFDPFRVKPYQYLARDNERRCGPAVIGSDQFKNRLLVGAYIPLFKLDSPQLEESLCDVARRSAGLGEEYHFLWFRHVSPGP